MVAEWAKRSAFKHHEEQMAGKPGNSISYRIAKKLVLSRSTKHCDCWYYQRTTYLN